VGQAAAKSDHRKHDPRIATDFAESTQWSAVDSGQLIVDSEGRWADHHFPYRSAPIDSQKSRVRKESGGAQAEQAKAAAQQPWAICNETEVRDPLREDRGLLIGNGDARA